MNLGNKSESVDAGQKAYLHRFSTSWSLCFREPATERLYTRFHSSLPALRLVPVVLALLAVYQSRDQWTLLALAGTALCAFSGGEVFGLVAAAATHIAVQRLADSPALSVFGYCSVGEWYSGLQTTWRRAAALATFLAALPDTHFPPVATALALIYLYERRQRELWKTHQVAKLTEKQTLEVLESQDIGLVVCDFAGKVLYSTPSAVPFLKVFSTDSVLSQEAFPSLLRKAQSGKLAQTQLLPTDSSESVSAKVTCRSITWYDRNCALVTFEQTGLWVRTVTAMSKVETKVLNEVATLERGANRKFRDTNDPSCQLELCRLRTVLHEVNTALAVQRACSGRYEGTCGSFDLRAEILDAVEFSSLWPENKALIVTLRFEPGVPSEVVGDRTALSCVFQYAYGRVAEASTRGSEISIQTLVIGADLDSVKIDVRFEAATEEWQKLAEDFERVGKSLCARQELAVADAALGAFQVMLEGMHGGCSCYCDSTFPLSQEQKLQLHCSFSLKPELKTEMRSHPPVPSLVRDQLSVDKFRWNYRADWSVEDKSFTRRQYKKKHLQVRGNETCDTPQPLTTIVEMISSEQFPVPDDFPPVEDYDSEDSPLHTHHRYGSLAPPYEVPIEAEASPMNRLSLHHCDLTRISSGQASQASPLGVSLRSL